MIPIGNFKEFSEPNPQLRILKPWWDVLSEYNNIAMVMLSLFTASVQTSYERHVCVAVPPGLALPQKVWNITELDNMRNQMVFTGFKVNLDIQYFALINQWCFDNYVSQFIKYFPYLILINSLIFLISSNFWFKFPGTSSKIEHFLSVLGKCLASPWTTKALSAAVYEDTAQPLLNISKPMVPRAAMQSTNIVDTEHKLAQPPPQGEQDPTVDGGGSTEQFILTRRPSKESLSTKVEDKSVKILDKKEGEQAKALFEKVKTFRVHTEEKDILYQMYKRQTFLRAFEAIVFIVYVSICLPDMQHLSYCKDRMNITGFIDYYCIHGMWRMYNMISKVYMIMLCSYCCLCVITLYWVFRHNLREYSFESIRKESGFNDIPDVVNDFAFLLHLIDQYDTLYSWQFAVFLSDASETKLLQVNLNHYWSIDKLREHLAFNSEGKTELCLYRMSGIPSQVFELHEIEVLKLESINMTIISVISNLKALNELWLENCVIKLDSQALVFLKKNLGSLKVRFSSSQQLPSWIYHMGSLQWLYLHGQLQLDKSNITFRSFRELKQLQFLYLKLSMGNIPATILDLAATVTTLIIHNEGTKLLSLANFKTFKKLGCLGLIQCRLEKIPNSIFSLTDLKEIEFEDNGLRSLEELGSFQNLKSLTSLKFSQNQITSIPGHIGQLSNVESLYLSSNMITALNPSVCDLKKLMCLDVSNNRIEKLPSEIGKLQDLHYLFASSNNIIELPKELFTCIKLQKLILSHNKIIRLPPLVGNLKQLRHLDLIGNQLEKLPMELEKCVFLSKAELQVEKEIYATLPVHVINQFQKKGR